MKNLLLTLSFCMLLISAKSQKLNAAKEVMENMKKQEQAWNNFDLEAYMKHYWNNDSLMFIGSKGITYGWKQTLANYKKSYPDKEAMGTLTFVNYNVEQLSLTSVYVIGHWQIKKKDKEVGGYYSLLWKKIKGEWVIVSDHTS